MIFFKLWLLMLNNIHVSKLENIQYKRNVDHTSLSNTIQQFSENVIKLPIDTNVELKVM